MSQRPSGDMTGDLGDLLLYQRTDTAERPAVVVPPDGQDAPPDRILSSSAVMAAGTVVSRASGFVRSALIAAALGTAIHADIFTIANTIPNALYILLAGGVFNAVLVPQLVRAMRNDADGGEAYTNRVVTVAALFLLVVTVALVALAPQITDIYLGAQYDKARYAGQRESAIAFARFCLPQVFFYGMFVLLGQILNARRRFGPMMWAPIANNLISVAVLVVYLVEFGVVRHNKVNSAFTSHQEAVLGLGSTLGIAVQLLVLLPYLRSAGFRFRPRLDLRGTGLGQTLRLGVWTVLFVVVNQIAYTVVVNLASEGSTYTVYNFAITVVMVPHAVITVSLATAVLPALSSRAAAGDLAGVAATLTSTLRSTLAVMLPFAALLPLVAPDAVRVLLHGAAADSVDDVAPVLALFAPGILFFTFHYLMLRGLYALELNRTVFVNQCFVAATNVAVALVLVHEMSTDHTAEALVVAYTASYAVGSLLSFLTLRRRLGGLDTSRTIQFGVRLVLAAAGSTAVAAAAAYGLHALQDDPSWPLALAFGAAIAVVDGLVFFFLARVMHIREVTTVLQTVGRRFSRA